MFASIARAFSAVEEAMSRRPNAYLIGIGGLPGSGKTTLCRVLSAALPDAGVVAMDGYHLPRAKLDAEGMRRRGARHTFDSAAFRTDVSRLRKTREGRFPAFDHAVGDPTANAVRIAPTTKPVFVEGLYVLMRDWKLESEFDLRVYLDCDLETALERVALRHLACGLAPTLDAARERANSNDRRNALDVINDGCRERADLVLEM